MSAINPQTRIVLVPSRTNPSHQYPVRQTLDGRSIGCPCKGRQFRPVVDCWHMRAAEVPTEIARLTRLAQRAVNRRTGHSGVPVNVTHLADDSAYEVTTNSGGNALAIGQHLGWAGYSVTEGSEPCSVRVESW